MAMRAAELVGMVVHGSEGERLGRLIQVEPGALVVEQGLLFPREFVIGFGHVKEVKRKEREVWLALPRAFYLEQQQAMERSGEALAFDRVIRTRALLEPPPGVKPEQALGGEKLEVEEEPGLEPDGVYDGM